jgi:hypothetical protein
MNDQKQQYADEIARFKALMEMPIEDHLVALARPLTDMGWSTSFSVVSSADGYLQACLAAGDRCPVSVCLEVRRNVPTWAWCACDDCENDHCQPLLLGEWIPDSGEDLCDWMARMDGVARAHREPE